MTEPNKKKAKVLAFYLPQFHPIPENDEWWGSGFTEWTNVVAAKSRFNGHNQPHIPADLGFYDLRLSDSRQAQADLAKLSGLDGFCYYHYWFNGRQLLERPFNEVLTSGVPDFPFCLCWANENWTRAWDGLEREILIQQSYTAQDSAEHIEWFIKAFEDRRYIKIDGRPLLLIYRIDNIPNIEEIICQWRCAVRSKDMPDLYLCAVKNGFVDMSDESIISLGFDAIVAFQPDRRDFPPPRSMMPWIYRTARKVLPDVLYQRAKLSASANNIISYSELANIVMNKAWPTKYRKFPCIFPSWDNSARRKSATIIQNNSPQIFGDWLSQSVRNVQSYPESEQIVFINAWNEWAEGCHLEPDLVYGQAFLDQIQIAIESAT